MEEGAVLCCLRFSNAITHYRLTSIQYCHTYRKPLTIHTWVLVIYWLFIASGYILTVCS